jgi:hypothetical protein
MQDDARIISHSSWVPIDPPIPITSRLLNDSADPFACNGSSLPGGSAGECVDMRSNKWIFRTMKWEEHGGFHYPKFKIGRSPNFPGHEIGFKTIEDS